MSQNYSGRIFLVLALLYAGLFGVPGLTDGIFGLHPFTENKPAVSLNLKPGIDIAGGTSLVYQIKKPEGYVNQGNGTLAEQVRTLLQKRVDPMGTKNLIWRPQGEDRLEIQLPRTFGKGEAGGQAARAKADYGRLVRDLKNYNVTTEQVIFAVTQTKGEARAKALDALAKGSEQRKLLFAQLTSLFDKKTALQTEVDAARAAGKKETDPDLQKKALELGEIKHDYSTALARIEEANINIADLEGALGKSDPASIKVVEDASARLPKEARNTLDQLRKVYPDYVRAKEAIGDTADLKRMLRGSGVLEFHILVENPRSEQPDMITRLENEGPIVKANDESRWFLVARPEEFRSSGSVFTNPRDGKSYVLAWITPEKSMVHKEGQKDWALTRAFEHNDQRSNSAVVSFEFDAVGGAKFGILTGNNIGKQLATILDNKIITAPKIQSQIHGSGIITLDGKSNTASERLYLINTFNAGSLPATLADEPISEREISPQLGEASLKAGLLSCLIGVIVIAIFMIFYYRLSGVVAVIALVFNMILILGILGMMGATFTLPGIAGLVLTIGVSVDANVLIFERLREEELRGLSLKMALRNAYDRAFTAILDSNVTTAITSAFLVYFGSEEVKGFGLTLLIGILCSMFSALVVTRLIFDVLIDKGGIRKLGSFPLSNPWWNKLLHPKIDWMGKIPYFLAFSILFTLAGMFAFFRNTGKLLDVEFAGGTEVQFTTNAPMTDLQIMERIAKSNAQIPQPVVSALGTAENGKYKEFSVVTPNPDRVQVSNAIEVQLKDILDIAVPSVFKVGAATTQSKDKLTVEQAQLEGAVIPVTIKSGRFTVLGRDIPDAAAFSGGAAIVMENLSPPLKPEEIRQRIDRAVAESLAQSRDTSIAQFEVYRLDGQTDESTPTDRAVAVVVNKNFPYDKNPAEWTEKVARPFWKAVIAGVGQDAKFQKVTNIDAQVAGATQQAAIFATLGSLVVIMIWIWIRFGDVKYGTATVAAMLHDTVLVVGAVGLSHWMDGTAIGHLLGVEGFRVNLTLVAAILTVMGYSMVDTIVVFDRIRENRGKYGTLSKQLINDSVNQTLSRTLLTAGTTMATLFVMYVWGGPAIHGFTFVLLVGILIGTYSSIAIAAPILLMGIKQPTSQKPKSSSTDLAKPAGKTQKVGA